MNHELRDQVQMRRWKMRGNSCFTLIVSGTLVILTGLCCLYNVNVGFQTSNNLRHNYSVNL